MNGPFSKKFSLQPLQIQANEHGLIVLNVKRRPSHPPVELPPGATPAQVIKVHLERLVDYLFGV